MPHTERWLPLVLWLASLSAIPSTLASPPSTPAASTTKSILFAGREHVSVGELFDALTAVLPMLAASPVVRSDFQQLFPGADAQSEAALFNDYVRVRLAFEATRAGGLWGIAWRVTDQPPQSDRIWTQWQAVRTANDTLPTLTAVAECDELSALFAFTAHRLGLSSRSQIGLFWPTWNHTVAVWTVDTRAGKRRIVVPTSQIFLDSAQTLGTRAFDPSRQKNIYDYRRTDISMQSKIPAALARQFVRAAGQTATRSHSGLQTLRNEREARQRALTTSSTRSRED